MTPNQQAFFFDAIRRGDTGDVSKALELLPELIDAPDTKGYTPIIIAAYNEKDEIVSLLLRLGANANSQDLAGNSALMGASFKGYRKIVEILLHHGASVNLLNGQGASALTFAATFGQLEIARLLLEHGANKNVRDQRNKSPLDHARTQENEAMISLLDQGLDQDLGI